MKNSVHLFLILAIGGSTSRGAPRDSVEFGYYVFKTFTDEGLYEDAKTFCKNDGGWIAEPVNASVNNALTGILEPGKQYWIGLRFDGLEWKWEQDGSVVGTKDWSTCPDPSDSCTCTNDYCNWYDTQGDNYDEDYAATTASGKWIDIDNANPRKFACQYVTPAQDSVIEGNYLFKSFSAQGLYEDAETFCRNDGGWIAEPTNEKFNNALARILPSANYWIGLRRNDSMAWQWQQNGSVVGLKNGSTCSDGYCNWHAGDGDQPGDTYAAILYSGEWIDVKLNYGQRKFACQYGLHCDDNPCENGSFCSVVSSKPYYNCTCIDAYFEYTCTVLTASYCDDNPCKNGGRCSVISSEPYYNCTCSDAYFGYNCTESYCDDKTCKNGGSCSVISSEPHYNCTCPDAYFGYNCTDYVHVNTALKVIAVEGYSFKLNASVSITGSTATVKLYFDGEVINEKNDVGNGTVTFTIESIKESNEGMYTFSASPPEGSYASTSTTFMTVHVEARIESISTNSLFSPVTTGPDSVTCEVYGIPTPVYGWYVNGAAVETTNLGSGVYQTLYNDTNAVILNIANAELKDEGTYECQATNRVGEGNLQAADNNTTFLSVYGSPAIQSIEATPCTDNAEVTVHWKPNNQTEKVAHKLLISREGVGIIQRMLSYPGDATASVSDLEPNTAYNAAITVCPDECLDFLNDATEVKTGDGTPDEVASAVVSNGETSTCVITWEPPVTPRGTITSYQVEWTSSYVYEPTGGFEQPEVVVQESGAEESRSEVEAEPNRVYSAVIYAKTCAGKGDKIEAIGSCVTPPAPPDNVTTPVVAGNSGDRTSTLRITIPGIDETNGQVSCVYILVQKGDGWNGKIFKPEDLEALEANALSGNKSEYLAVALTGAQVGQVGTEAVLGDDAKTSCNPISVGRNYNRKKRAAEDGNYQGLNIPLEYTGVKYSFLTLTATPVGETFKVNQSSVQKFTQGSSLYWIIGVVVAVIVLAGILVTVICLRRRNQRKEKERRRSEENAQDQHVYYTIPERPYKNARNNANYENVF